MLDVISQSLSLFLSETVCGLEHSVLLWPVSSSHMLFHLVALGLYVDIHSHTRLFKRVLGDPKKILILAQVLYQLILFCFETGSHFVAQIGLNHHPPVSNSKCGGDSRRFQACAATHNS